MDPEHHFTGVYPLNPERTEVMLLERSPHKEKLPGFIATVGGGVEPGETPDQTMRRECGEEFSNIDWSAVPDLRRRKAAHSQSCAAGPEVTETRKPAIGGLFCRPMCSNGS